MQYIDHSSLNECQCFLTSNPGYHVDTVVTQFHLPLCRLTDDESRENWEKYGNPDGPTGEWN